MTFEYIPSGVCSRKYTFDIDGDVINSVSIEGGCPGNLLGISRLVRGMKVEEVIEDFKGVCCGGKNTSCPDQIATALQKYLQGEL